MAGINSYALGQQAALEKYAGKIPGKPGMIGGAIDALKKLFTRAPKGAPPPPPPPPKGTKLRRAGRWMRDFAIGSPKQFANEVMSGKALSKGSLIREGFKAPTMLDKALFYGYPAYDLGSITGDAEGDKAHRVGESLGGAAASLALFRPLGLVGAMGGGILGGALGGRAGTAVGHATGVGNKIDTAEYGGPEEGIRY